MIMARTPAPTLPMSYKYLGAVGTKDLHQNDCVFLLYGPLVQRYTLLGKHVRVANGTEDNISAAATDIDEKRLIDILQTNGLTTTIDHEIKRVKRKHKQQVEEARAAIGDAVEKTVEHIVKKIERFFEDIEAGQSKMLTLTGQMYDVEGLLGSAKLRYLLKEGESLTPLVDILSNRIKELKREHYT